MRSLASIQKVLKVEPISGADRIELATVLGWHVVIRKGEFKKGDLVIYVEIDSILPAENPDFAFLEGKRIRTKKLRGVYSQGICFPLSILPKNKDWRIGDDVTEVLKVTKYEPDERNVITTNAKKSKWYLRYAPFRWIYKKLFKRKLRTDFPTELIPKSDETRVQVMQDVLDTYKGTPVIYTEKVDGSSITFWVNDCLFTTDLHVCSRNKQILDYDDFMFRTAHTLKADLESKYIYRGEILGPGVQGNKYHLKNYKIYIYDIYERATKTFLSYDEMRKICLEKKFDFVPEVGMKCLSNNIDTLVGDAVGTSLLYKTPREGIVIRPITPINGVWDDRFVGGRVSFKAINPEFLVKYKA